MTFQGMRYLFDNGLVSNNASEIASFFHCTRAKLSKTQIRHYLQVSSFSLPWVTQFNHNLL